MADQDLDRSEAAGTGEARVPRPGQDQPPRVPGQQPPAGTRDGSGPEVPDPQPELPDAFAPGLALSAHGDPALDRAGAEPSDAGDPYGPPDDLDTADAYGPAEGYGTADPPDPGSYGLGALGLVGDDYDTGDEYRPSDNHEAPGQDSPLSLIRNSAGPPVSSGCRRPPGPIPGWRSRQERTLGRRNSVRDRVPPPRCHRSHPRPRQHPHLRERSRPTASPPTCSCQGGTTHRPAAGAAQSSR